MNYKCNHCNNIYKHRSSKSKHEKVCKTKIQNDNKYEILINQNKDIETKMNKIIQFIENIKIYNNDNKFFYDKEDIPIELLEKIKQTCDEYFDNK